MNVQPAQTSEDEAYVDAPRIVVRFDPDRRERRRDLSARELEELIATGGKHARRSQLAGDPFAAWAADYPFLVGRGPDQTAAIEDLARRLRLHVRDPLLDEPPVEGELASLARDLDEPELVGVLRLIALPIELPPDCALALARAA